MTWRVEFQLFRKDRDTGDDVFDDAVAFAAQFSSERLIGISHALEKNQIVAVVWSWSEGSFWVYSKCGECVEEQFDSCWSCSSPRPEETSPAAQTESQDSSEGELSAVAFRTDRGSWLEWEDFFGELAKIATAIGPERLVSIAHSGTKDDAIGSVFYLCKKQERAQQPIASA